MNVSKVILYLIFERYGIIKRIYYLVKLMKLREKFRIMATVGGRHFKTFTSIPILLSFDRFTPKHVPFCDSWSSADSLLKSDNKE